MEESTPSGPAATDNDGAPGRMHRVGRFIERYSTFLSSFVLGLAGLIGTALYQREQTKISNRQAEAQIAVSQNQATTQWKIARAEILSKNLQLLLDKKPETVDQRYGVLLSLTREDVLDPELAMSYAFDLQNADYIKSVIIGINNKNWSQIFHNFQLPCELRYGVWRDVAGCRAADGFEARAQAMTDVVAEELSRGSKEPFRLLSDERQLHAHLMRLVYLFAPYLRQTYFRQRMAEVERFEAQSPGAEMVAAFVLAGDPSGELLAADTAAQRSRFHEERQRRLEKMVLASSCDNDCRGQAAELLLNGLLEYGAPYATLLRKLVERQDATQAMARLHRRLLWCQLERRDADRFLREVLLPAYADLSRPGPAAGSSAAQPAGGGGRKASGPPPRDRGHDGEHGDHREHLKSDLVELLALLEVPDDVKLPEAVERAMASERARVKKQRDNPRAALRKYNFCNAPGEEISGSEDL